MAWAHNLLRLFEIVSGIEKKHFIRYKEQKDIVSHAHILGVRTLPHSVREEGAHRYMPVVDPSIGSYILIRSALGAPVNQVALAKHIAQAQHSNDEFVPQHSP